MRPSPIRPVRPSPFDLGQPQLYEQWREFKLAQRGLPPRIEIGRLDALTGTERQSLLATVRDRNFALFRNAAALAGPALEDSLRAMGRQFGLLELDQNLCAEDSGLTAITVKPTDTDHTYIPYTNRPLGWHTDGYYNAGDLQVRAWLLYCAQPAGEGGANEFMDHEIAYIRLRDENPEWVRALMEHDAFTIPRNVEKGSQIRPDHTGPVFSISQHDGHLHMRYSARQRNVAWKSDRATRDAARFLMDLFQRGDDHIFGHRLQAGEGLISNNVLHRRDGFRDPDNAEAKRLMYRARYYQRLPDA